jgi:5-oxoprolinase (ATP-hydrolysing) subunit A
VKAASSLSIDLNADVGESYGPWLMGPDEELIPLVTSVNIACGGHAGDPVTILRTARTAVTHGVAIGAHPGYPDLAGFGRRELELSDDELRSTVIVQVGAVVAGAHAAGGAVRHVKPHGAMYNRAARDPATARAIAAAIRDLDPDLVLVGLAASASIEAARDVGLRVAEEAFADRRYERDGSLRSRRLGGAMLDAVDAAVQAVSIVRDRVAVTADGAPIAIRADTLCVHGDTPGAVEIARRVRAELTEAGVTIRPFEPIGR